MPLPCSIDSKSITTLSELELQEWPITEGIYYLCANSTNETAEEHLILKSHKQQSAITSKNGNGATKMVAFSAVFLPGRASLFVKSCCTEESFNLSFWAWGVLVTYAHAQIVN